MLSAGLRPIRGGLAEHVDTAAAGGLLASVGALEAIGLPVQIAGVWPWSLPYSSIIQAITLGVGGDVRGRDVAGRAEDLSILSMNERHLLDLGPTELILPGS